MIGLAGTFAATGSVVPVLDTWLESVCTQDCTPAALANASAIIEGGCSTDLAAGASVAVGLEMITQNYTLFRNALCLEKAPAPTASSKAAPDFCVSDILAAVQNATGSALNSTTLLTLATGGTAQLVPLFAAIPPSAVCTDCVHAMLTELAPLIGAEYGALGGAVLNGMCGGSGAGNFSDGLMPTGVVEAVSAATAKATTGQAAVSTSGAGLARGVWGVVGSVGMLAAGALVLL